MAKGDQEGLNLRCGRDGVLGATEDGGLFKTKTDTVKCSNLNLYIDTCACKLCFDLGYVSCAHMRSQLNNLANGQNAIDSCVFSSSKLIENFPPLKTSFISEYWNSNVNFNTTNSTTCNILQAVNRPIEPTASLASNINANSNLALSQDPNLTLPRNTDPNLILRYGNNNLDQDLIDFNHMSTNKNRNTEPVNTNEMNAHLVPIVDSSRQREPSDSMRSSRDQVENNLLQQNLLSILKSQLKKETNETINIAISGVHALLTNDISALKHNVNDLCKDQHNAYQEIRREQYDQFEVLKSEMFSLNQSLKALQAGSNKDKNIPNGDHLNKTNQTKQNASYATEAKTALNSTQTQSNIGNNNNKNSWAARLLTKQPLNSPPNLVSLEHNDPLNKRKLTKKIIMPPFDIGRGKSIETFFSEFERIADAIHERSTFNIVIKDHLEGQALNTYEDVMGHLIPYDALKDKMLHFLKLKEDMNIYPQVPPDIKYDPKRGAYSLLSRITAHIGATYGDTLESRNVCLTTIWDRLPVDLARTLKEQSCWEAKLEGSKTVELDHVLQAAWDRENTQNFIERNNSGISAAQKQQNFPNEVTNNNTGSKNKTKTFAATNTTSSSNKSPDAGNNDVPNSNSSNTGARQKTYVNSNKTANSGNKSNSQRSYANSNYPTNTNRTTPRPYCWMCKGAHWMQYCDATDFPHMPNCNRCNTRHNYLISDCPPSQANNSNQPEQSKSVQVSPKNRQVTSMQSNTDNTFRWSTLKNMDELSTLNTDNSTVSVNAHTTVQKNLNKIDHNSNKTVNAQTKRPVNTRFIRDSNKFNSKQTLECLLQQAVSLSPKKYSCHSRKCTLKHHSTGNPFDREKFKSELILDLQKDFPGCYLAAEKAVNEISTNKVNKPNLGLKTLPGIPMPCSNTLPTTATTQKPANTAPVASETNQNITPVITNHTLTKEISNHDKLSPKNKLPLSSETMGNLNESLESEASASSKGDLTQCKAQVEVNVPEGHYASIPDLDSNFVPFSDEDNIDFNQIEIHNETTDNPTTRPITMALSDLMYIFIDVGEARHVRALVDSGASLSTIDYNLIPQINSTWETSDMVMLGFGQGQQFDALESSNTPIFVEGLRMQPQKLYTLPNVPLSYPVILGRDFLTVNKVIINPKTRNLKIKRFNDQGHKTTLTIHSTIENVNNKACNISSTQPVSTLQVPCYLNKFVNLIKDSVTILSIKSDESLFREGCIPLQNNSTCYLEIDPKLTGIYPNFGIIKPLLAPQTIEIISGSNMKLNEGKQIGYICTGQMGQIKEQVSNDWSPDETVLYSVMTDQQVADALNKSPTLKTCANPTAILDYPLPTYGNLPMNETPPEFALSHRARIFPPRDMTAFEDQHAQWLQNPQPDGIPNEWTMDRIKDEFIVSTDDMTDDQLDRFYNLLHKYRVCFARDENDVNISTLGEIELVLKDEEKYNLSAKPTKWTPEGNRMIKEILDGYLKAGVIKHGSGPYASRVFIVYRRTTPEEVSPKPRLVIDYRQINKSLIPCSKYLAGVESLLLKIKNHNYYSKLDLKSAYHQIGIVEHSKDISSIITFDAQYVFNCMSFGLSVSPAFFEIFMEYCFRAIPDDVLAHYLDDCILAADTINEMIDRIGIFLHYVTKHRLKLSAGKCHFFKKSINFLGFILNKEGIRKSSEYVNRIQEAPRPRTVHELMKFVGLVNFQRKFVPHCSVILRPLIEKINHKAKNLKKAEITWTTEMEEAFIKIKKVLAEDVALAFPDTSEGAEPLRLYTDASMYASGSSLFQVQQGTLRPLSFTSKLFSKTELRYSAYDKEILAFVRGITAHRQFLLGRHFTVYTDCRNLVYLYRMKNSTPRLLRLMEQLAEYNFTIEHIAGIDNYVSDLLSRIGEYTPPEFYKHLVDETPAEYIPKELTEIKGEGGAESPFYAIHICLLHVKQINITPEALRAQLIGDILDNPKKFNLQGKEKETDMSNIRAMLKTGVSTYLIIFQAAAYRYDINFLVYIGIEQPLIFRPYQRKNAVKIPKYENAYIICRGQGCHYNALLPREKKALENKELSYILEATVNDNDDSITDSEDDNDPNDTIYQLEDTLNPNENLELFAHCYNEKFQDKADLILAQSVLQQHSSLGEMTEKLFIYLPPRNKQVLCNNSRHTIADISFVIAVEQEFFRSISGGQSSPRLCLALDTGSSISIISASTFTVLFGLGFATASTPVPQGQGKINILGSHTNTNCSTIIQLPFWNPAKNNIREHEFFILDDQCCSSCLLIGADFLNKLDVGLTFEHLPINYDFPSLTVTNLKGKTAKVQYFEQIENSCINASLYCFISNVAYINTIQPAPIAQKDEKLTKLWESLNSPKSLFKLRDLILMQKRNNQVAQVRRAVNKNNRKQCPFAFKNKFDCFSIVSDLLIFDSAVPVVPKSLAIEIIANLHEQYGHIGRDKIWATANSSFWSPNLYTTIGEITTSCPLCQCLKADTAKHPPPLYKRVAKSPYDLICVDLLTLPKTKRGNCNLLVVSDFSSKFLRCYPQKDYTAETVIKNLTNYANTSVKCMKSLLSDNAKIFKSEAFEDFCTEKDIIHIYSCVGQSHCNGFSEKNCGIVVQQLRFVAKSIEDWDLEIENIVGVYNNTINVATGQTPSSFILENSHVLDLDRVLPSKITDLWKVGSPHFAPFKLGDEVLLKKKFVGDLATHKLKPRFDGIFHVTKISGRGLSYDIKNIHDDSDERINVHYNDLRLFSRPSQYLHNNYKFKQIYKRWFLRAFPIDGAEDESSDSMEKVDFLGDSVDADADEDDTQSVISNHSAASTGSTASIASTSLSEESNYDFALELNTSYQDYVAQHIKYRKKFNIDLPLIPLNCYATDLQSCLDQCALLYCNYSKIGPRPSVGFRTNLGNPKTGVHLAIRTVEHAERNEPDPLFDLNEYKNLLDNSTNRNEQFIYKIAITYNLELPLKLNAALLEAAEQSNQITEANLLDLSNYSDHESTKDFEQQEQLLEIAYESCKTPESLKPINQISPIQLTEKKVNTDVNPKPYPISSTPKITNSKNVDASQTNDTFETTVKATTLYISEYSAKLEQVLEKLNDTVQKNSKMVEQKFFKLNETFTVNTQKHIEWLNELEQKLDTQLPPEVRPNSPRLTAHPSMLSLPAAIESYNAVAVTPCQTCIKRQEALSSTLPPRLDLNISNIDQKGLVVDVDSETKRVQEYLLYLYLNKKEREKAGSPRSVILDPNDDRPCNYAEYCRAIDIFESKQTYIEQLIDRYDESLEAYDAVPSSFQKNKSSKSPLDKDNLQTLDVAPSDSSSLSDQPQSSCMPEATSNLTVSQISVINFTRALRQKCIGCKQALQSCKCIYSQPIQLRKRCESCKLHIKSCRCEY